MDPSDRTGGTAMSYTDVILDAERPESKPVERKQPVRARTISSSASYEERYIEAAIDGEVERVAQAPDGTRNQTLNRAAFAMAQFADIPDTRIEYELTRAGMACGLEKIEMGPTIASGIKAGRKEPRQIPESKYQTIPNTGEPPAYDDGPYLDEHAPPGLQSPDGEAELSPVADFTAGVIEMIERRAEGKEPPVPVPFADYAAALDGGLRPGVTTIVSTTGASKSQFVAQQLRHAGKCGIPSLLISLELTQQQATTRLLCDCAGVSWSKCEKGQASALDVAALRSVKAELDALPISVEYGRPQRYTVTDVAIHVAALRKKNPTDRAFVAVDFAQLVGTENKGDLREKFGSVMYDLQSIARTYDVAMMAVSSTARANYSLLADIEQSAKLTVEHGERIVGNPTAILASAKEAGEAEFASDVLWVLAGWPTRLANGDHLVIAAQAKYRWSGVKRWFAMANHGGQLHEFRVDSMDDLPEVERKSPGIPKVDDNEITARVLDYVRTGKATSRRNARDNVTGNAGRVEQTWDELAAAGRIQKADSGIWEEVAQ
jgi:hypothetical protein